jgi:hypothetical protein
MSSQETQENTEYIMNNWKALTNGKNLFVTICEIYETPI